jgi:hypothetical protein
MNGLGGHSPKLNYNDIVFSFDTTGSMYPCLTQVRRLIADTALYLFDTIPSLRIGIIAHGDYCDGADAISTLDLTPDVGRVVNFVNQVPPTSGGDSDECYELVLHRARDFNWTSGKQKALVLIGDALPHRKGERNCGTLVAYDWRNEANMLLDAGIKVYPVQAMGRRGSDAFYDALAKESVVPKLELPQFSDINDILCALCFQQAGQLDQFERHLKTRKVAPSRHVLLTLDKLAGRKLSQRSEKLGSRFQVLEVDRDTSIREFVEANGLTFEKGRGFYEFTKREEIQEYKEVVAQNRDSGAIIAGKRARSVLGIPAERVTMKPESETHLGFVQSTSVNRKLKAGTKFLYEVAETEGLEV